MQQLQEEAISREIENEKFFQKEIFVLRNDLYYKFLEHRNERWFVDIAYKPKQMPSGDLYSIRRIDSDRIAVLLFDAMGKGLNASITSILAGAYLNNYIDESLERGDFRLCDATKRFHRFIKPLLFEDEALSCSFVVIDLTEKTIESAMFGMPPILMCDQCNEIDKIRSNHPPMTRESTGFDTQTDTIENIVKLLLYTDGLNETLLPDHMLYHTYLSEDFKHAPNYKHFLQTVMQRTERFDDDMTFLFLEKELCNRCSVRRYTIQSRQKEVDTMIANTERFLDEHGMDAKNRAYMLEAFSEMLINAYEHGNLGIDHKTKQKLLEEGLYESYLQEREAQYKEKKIKILLHLKEEEHLKTFKIDIEDEGKGFDTALMRNRIIKKSQFHGRGLLMVSKMVDAYYYNDRANRVIIKKFIPKESKDDNQ